MTTTAFPVRTVNPDPLVAAETIASLPVSFAHADTADPTAIVEVAGDAAWPDTAAAAIRDGARGVIVTAPSITDADRVLALSAVAAEQRVPVILAEPFAGNLALLGYRDRITDVLRDASAVFVQVHDDVASSETLALTAIRTLRALGIHLETVSATTAGRGGFVLDATATTNGSALTAAVLGFRTDALEAAVSIRAYGPTGMLEIDLPAPTTARPAAITVTSEDGSTTLPSLYENAYRSAWRRAHDVLTAGGTGDDVDAFTADLTLTLTNTPL
jgi:hypothetical protein